MSDDLPQNTNLTSHQAWRILLVLLLIVAGCLFIIRGPARGMSSQGGYDLSMLYAASKAWATGANPYSGDDCVAVLNASGGESQVRDLNPQKFASLYPPTFFPLLAPLSGLDWPVVRVFWALLQVLAVGVILQRLFVFAGRPNLNEQLMIAAIVLASGPLHSSLYVGQAIIIVLALVLVGLTIQNPWAAGLCIGLATMLKPQVGLPFLFLFIWERQWLALLTSIALTGLVTAVSVARLSVTAPTWRLDLSHNLSVLTQPTGLGSPLPSNPLVYQMIDAAPFFSALGLSATAANVLAWLIAVLAAGTAVYGLSRLNDTGRRGLLIAGLASVPLVPVYHRYYDAAMLLLVFAWVLPSLRRRALTKSQWFVLACLIPFLFPTAAVLATFYKRGMIPESIYQAWGFQTFVMQHHSLLLILLVIGLAYHALMYHRSGSAELQADRS